MADILRMIVVLSALCGLSGFALSYLCLLYTSLFGTDAIQTQDTIEGFCAKIKAGKEAQVPQDFMIIARIESLIAGKPMSCLLYTSAGRVEKATGVWLDGDSPRARKICAIGVRSSHYEMCIRDRRCAVRTRIRSWLRAVPAVL